VFCVVLISEETTRAQRCIDPAVFAHFVRFPTRTPEGRPNIRKDYTGSKSSNLSFSFDRASRFVQSDHTDTAEFNVIVPGESIPPADLDTLRDWASRPTLSPANAALSIEKNETGVSESSSDAHSDFFNRDSANLKAFKPKTATASKVVPDTVPKLKKAAKPARKNTNKGKAIIGSDSESSFSADSESSNSDSVSESSFEAESDSESSFSADSESSDSIVRPTSAS